MLALDDAGTSVGGGKGRGGRCVAEGRGGDEDEGGVVRFDPLFDLWVVS